MRTLYALLCLFTLAILAGCDNSPQQVNVYSARKEELIKPLLDQFAEESGIQVNLITGKADALMERIKSEGEFSPADLLITVDAGRLHRAREPGHLSKIDSRTLDERVPATLRDPDGYWYGLSVRARVIVYAPDRVDPAALASYQGLTDEQWQGRICIRSSDNIYNQSLVASLIAHDGAEATEAWARGVVANMARDPVGGDRDQIRAVAAGECDLAVVNTYYLGMMLTSDDQAERDVAAQVAVFWPNQASTGTHINVSGAGIPPHAPNREAALKLLGFLLSDQSQAWYARTNFEYPVRSNISVNDTLNSWGEFRQDELPLVKLGELNAEAVRLLDRAGWK